MAYLGHIVSANGLKTDPRKIEAVIWTTPKMETDVRSFLGITNHYWQFIKGYTKVTKPLISLVSGNNADRKKALVK